jgi:hypothetical protein
MRYFLRTLNVSAGHILGPFGPIETLQRARMLRESGIDYFITTEFGVLSGARMKSGTVKSEKSN